MDYRQLLIKYISHVEIAEGTTFINDAERRYTHDEVPFTDEEWAELKSVGKSDGD